MTAALPQMPAGALGTLAAAATLGAIGLSLGSFIAALAWRLPLGQGPLGRSRCTGCGVALGVADLVPVVSALIARGRCRHCGHRYGARYAGPELATAAAWLLSFAIIADLTRALLAAALGSVLVLLATIDVRHRYLPDAATLIVAALAFVRIWLGTPAPGEALAGLLAFGTLALALRWSAGRWLRREALGLGDVKLMAAAGLWLGAALLPAFLILAGGAGIAWSLALRRREFPFGPSLALALFVLVLWWR